MSPTPIFLMKSWSVRGSEMPGHLVALESETSFDLPFGLSFDLCLVFAACHLFTISESSFWYDRITHGTYNCPSCCCGGGGAGAVCARGGDDTLAGGGEA